MIVAGTGHRPDKLGGYDNAAENRLCAFAARELVKAKIKYPDLVVISGMALGWDQALATAAVEQGIPLHAYIPFEGQESRWPVHSQEHFRWLRSKVNLVVVCSPGGYSAEKMQIRNVCMVNEADLVLALWNGSAGGTANCVNYARSNQKRVYNCWLRWQEFRGR